MSLLSTRGDAAEAMRTTTSSTSSSNTSNNTGLSIGAIAGIAVAGAVLLFIGLAPLLVWLARLQDRRHARRDEANHQHLQLHMGTDGRNGGLGISDGRPKTSAGPGPDVGGNARLSAKHFEAGEFSESDACLDLGDGKGGEGVASVTNEKRIRRKTLKKKGGSTSSREIFEVDKIEEGKQRTSAVSGGAGGDASVVTPFLARPYQNEIQYGQHPIYRDEKEYHGVRTSEHGQQRTWAGDDDETLMEWKKRTSGTTLANFAGNSAVVNNAETNDSAWSPTSATNNRSMIRSWFPQTLGKTLSRKLSFGSRHVEEIIGNPRLLNNANSTSGAQNTSKNANGEGDGHEEISVHNTPRATPVIVHNEGEDYLHTWQAGGDNSNRNSNRNSSGHPANRAPVIPRAPSSVIHNPRQRTAKASAADALQKQKMAFQQQQQQQMQMQQHQRQQQMYQQQQLMLMHHQQQQLYFMNMQMDMGGGSGVGVPMHSNTSSPQVSPPKRPPRFRTSATDSELTEILRMTAERLEDRNRHERRHHVLNSSNDGDMPNADIDGNAEQTDSTSPSKSIGASARRETMMSSDTTGDNINIIIPPVIHSNSQIQSPKRDVGSAPSSQVSQQQVPERSPARQGTSPHQQHRRRISHVSFNSMISEPDSLVAGDQLGRPLSRAGSNGHATPLSSPSRKQSFASPDEILQQAHISYMNQQSRQSPQRQPLGAVGGSHRPFSPASTESSALSTLYSEDEPTSGGGSPGSGIAGSRRQPQRTSLNSRNSMTGPAPVLPAGLCRTESQRTALAEILRRSRDFDAESTSLAPNSLGGLDLASSKVTTAMSPAPLRLRNSSLISGSEGGMTTNDHSPATRDFEMVTHNGNGQRASATTVGTDVSSDLVTAMSPTAGGDDPFVSATPQHNARLSQLFSPLPKEGPRPTAINAANAVIRNRCWSGSSPVSGGKLGKEGADRSSTMGGGTVQLSAVAGAQSPSKRLTLCLTKATPEAETPCSLVHSGSVVHTPHRDSSSSNSVLDVAEGSPTLRAIDLDMNYDESPAAGSETRLSSLYDSYNYSISASASDVNPSTASTTAHPTSTTRLTGHDNDGSASSSRYSFIDNAHYRPESFQAVASAQIDADNSSTLTGTDSNGTIKGNAEDVMTSSQNYHFGHSRLPSDERSDPQRFSRPLFDQVADQPRLTYDLIESDEAPTPCIPEKHRSRERGTFVHHTTVETVDGTDLNDENNINTNSTAGHRQDDEGDAVGHLSTSESNIKALNSMRVTQAIVELRRMNSQMSTTSGYSALTQDGSTFSTGGASNSSHEGTMKGGTDSPTLPQLRGGGFSPSKRSSSIMGRRNYLSLGGKSSTSGGGSKRGSHVSVPASVAAASAVLSDDGDVGSGMTSDSGAESSSARTSRNLGVPRRGGQVRHGKPSAERRAAWRRTVADPTGGEDQGDKLWGVNEKVGGGIGEDVSAADGFLSSRKSLHENMARSVGRGGI